MNDQIINLQYLTIKDPLPDFIYDGLREYSKNANGYKPQPPELVDKLAIKVRVPKSMIFLTDGIDESIAAFIQKYGTTTQIFTPTYIVYTDALVFGKKLVKVNVLSNETYAIDPKHYPDITLFFLANPNNPTGIISKETIIKLAENNPQAIICIDEAYGEFSDESVVQEVGKHKNLVVFRTFSKAYGMAGNRIGYFIAQPQVIAEVKPFIQWANVSYLSVGAAITALDHEEYFQEKRNGIISRREQFQKSLQQMEFTVLPTNITAVLIKLSSAEKATSLVDFLRTNNIVVSHGNGNSNVGLDDSYIRLSIGNDQQMKIVESVLKTWKND